MRERGSDGKSERQTRGRNLVGGEIDKRDGERKEGRDKILA